METKFDWDYENMVAVVPKYGIKLDIVKQGDEIPPAEYEVLFDDYTSDSLFGKEDLTKQTTPDINNNNTNNNNNSKKST